MSDDENKVDHVARAAKWIMRRGEDGELLNPHLEELESQLFLKISNQGLNEALGDATMRAFQTEMAMEIMKTISTVAKNFEID